MVDSRALDAMLGALHRAAPNGRCAANQARPKNKIGRTMEGIQPAPSTVVRYDKRRHVESFFRTGELRLAPLVSFGTSAVAEPMRDPHEGWGHVAFDHGSGRFSGIFTPPVSVLVLCCSVVDSTEHARLLKGADGAGIRIENLDRFARKIAVSLDGCVHSAHGHCNYSGRIHNAPVFGLDAAMDSFTAAKDQDPGAALHELWDRMVKGDMGRQWCFTKEPKHAHEQEYRFVWYLNRTVRQPVTLEFPHARRACSRAWI
jgi:hypothetical protein